MLDKVYRRASLRLGGRREHKDELRHLSVAPWESPEAMDELRVEHLATAVRRAATSSPYYRRLLEGSVPNIASLEDLAQIPVTSKVDIMGSGFARAAPGLRARRASWRTSGSSGEPFVFEVDLGYRARFDAQRAYVYRRAGCPDGSKIVEVLGGSRLTSPRLLSYPTFRRTIVGYGRSDVSAVVERVRPKLLYGNRSHLLSVVDELGARGRSLGVDLVCSSSETLHPDDEERLADCFGARVMEVYGSAEAGNLAFRCRESESGGSSSRGSSWRSSTRTGARWRPGRRVRSW